MDWKNNQAVGLGAAALVILGIVGVFMYMKSSAPENQAMEMRKLYFLCKSTNQTFSISEKQIHDSAKDYATFNCPYGQETVCKVDGKNDAQRAYYCRVCKLWYAYKAGQETTNVMRCPKEHDIEDMDR